MSDIARDERPERIACEAYGGALGTPHPLTPAQPRKRGEVEYIRADLHRGAAEALDAAIKALESGDNFTRCLQHMRAARAALVPPATGGGSGA